MGIGSVCELAGKWELAVDLPGAGDAPVHWPHQRWRSSAWQETVALIVIAYAHLTSI
jgi:hypothetical protein